MTNVNTQFKPGNKAALGHGYGAPRTVCPSDPELIALGEEMLTWIKANNPLHVSAWYSLEKFITFNTWKAMIQHSVFLPYYERALLLIGQQYLDKDSKVREGISQRWQRVYFKDLRDQEDQDLKDKLERDKELATHKAKAEAAETQTANLTIDVINYNANHDTP